MKLYKIIYNTFLVGIAIIALLLIVSIFPITGNYKILIVKSGSMAPAIKTGSVVVVKPAKNYKIGDVITFGEMGKGKTPVSHRIYDIKDKNGQKSYVTKGDTNNSPDANEISEDKIIGKVILIVPYAGYAVATAKKPLGFLLIIVVPALIIIYDEMRKIYLEMKKLINRKIKIRKKGDEMVINLKN